MKKKNYLIFSLFLLVIIVFMMIKNLYSNNSCQTEILQTNQEAYLFTPFMITDGRQRIFDYETEFIKNIEDIKREYLQKEIITSYITDTLHQKDLFSNIKETQFYELSTEEKIEILDTSNTNTTYHFGDDVVAMKRRKIYRFGAFQLALCGRYFGAGIPCINNDKEKPFQIVEQGSVNIFTGALIRKIGEQQRHHLLLPPVGDGPVSLWIKNGKLFLAMRIIPEGEYLGAIEWYGAIYTLETFKGERMEEGRVFQGCYDTAYKEIDLEYLGLSGSLFWDNWLFMEDTLLPPKYCF